MARVAISVLVLCSIYLWATTAYWSWPGKGDAVPNSAAWFGGVASMAIDLAGGCVLVTRRPVIRLIAVRTGVLCFLIGLKPELQVSGESRMGAPSTIRDAAIAGSCSGRMETWQ
jgi:hypothetical protein